MSKKCQKCKKILDVMFFKNPENINDKTYANCINCRLNLISKKNICDVCGIRASFNYEGCDIGIKCSKHKEPEMIDIKNKKCESCKKKHPSFNYENETVAKFCSDCKEPEMIDVKSKKCEICKKKQPNFNYENEPLARFCSKCKEPEMIDIKNKKCEICKKKQPVFNYENEPLARFCSDCKEPEMIDIKHKKCERCKKKHPVFNYENEQLARFCSDCKEPEMINIKSKKCKSCKKKHPTSNYENETAARFCSDCKEPEMIDVKHKKCEESGCRKRPSYSYPGNLPKFCKIHRKDGMLLNPRKKCSFENCNDSAIYGIQTPTHCENHSTIDEYNMAERACVKCGKLDILNKEGLCVNFCSFEEKDRMMKKRLKKHEEFIIKLLKEEILMDMYTCDMVIDSNCCKYRPDCVYHCGTHIVIIEVDEDQHKSYTNCGYTKEEKIKGENKRMFSIGQSFDGLPCIFIRYNPDSYTDCNDKKGVIGASKRHEIFIKWVNKCIKNGATLCDGGYKVKYLFYDNFIESDGSLLTLNYEDLIL